MNRHGLLCLLLGVGGCSNSVAVFERLSGDDAEVPPDARVELDGGLRDADSDDAGEPPSDVLAVAAFGHTCALNYRALSCWGRNDANQLGLASAAQHHDMPTRLDEHRYISVCAGEEHSCAVRDDGRLACWGGNRHGQLGLGDTMPRATPTLLPEGLVVQRLSCAGATSCAIDAQGVLSCWGQNFEGQAGQDDPFGSADVLLPSPVARAGSYADVAVGQGHVCAIDADGALYCWGRNTQGQLGIGDREQQVRTPTQVTPGARYTRVAAAMQHGCAIRADGRLFCWGDNLDGLLGAGSSAARHSEPVQVGELSDYRDVGISWFHSCALRAEGQLACWGRNAEGQLGVGDSDARAIPSELSGGAFSSLAVGQFHTCAVRAGSLYCWGKNEAGELGIGPVGRRDQPALVALPE